VVRNTRSGGMGKLPGLKSSKYYDLAKEYLPKGQNGIVTFGLKEVLKRLRLLLMKRKYFHF
jgi:O-acetylhomoserine (thiol)-lyase